MNQKDFVSMIKETYQKWQNHDATLRAAAITFFVMMPLPSLTLISIEIFALIYGGHQALQQFIHQVSEVAGPNIANIVSELLKNAQSPLTSIFGSIISVGFTLGGAIGAFSVLQKSVNTIWEIKPPQTKGLSKISGNLLPFILITVVGIVIVAWTAFSSVLFGIVVLILHPLFGSFTGLILRGLQVIFSFGLGTLLFAIIFKQLPQIKITWRDVILAAAITSLVFTLLNYLFGVYLSVVHTTTLAGTAGTLMVLFLWLYFTSLFLLFGAQFSKVYTEKEGSLSKVKSEPSKRPQKKKASKVNMNLKLDWTISPNPKENQD